MSMIDSLIEGLGKAPAVQEAMNKLQELKVAVVLSLTRFNEKLETLEANDKTIIENQEKILRLINGDPTVVPAADDGLLKLLAEHGEEMIIIGSGSDAEKKFQQNIADAVVTHESEVSHIG